MQDQSLSALALRCSAFDLVTALDAYETASKQLVALWPDVELYAGCRRQVEAIRQYGVSVPPLTVLSLQLVIAHHELASILWQRSSVAVAPSSLQEVQARHALALDALRVAASSLLRVD